jgi:hypothetical protein
MVRRLSNKPALGITYFEKHLLIVRHGTAAPFRRGSSGLGATSRVGEGVQRRRARARRDGHPQQDRRGEPAGLRKSPRTVPEGLADACPLKGWAKEPSLTRHA